MSTHTAIVVRVKMEPHPDAEALSIMKLESGNVVVLRTSEWTDGELAVHIEPDFEVNVEHAAFNWLATKKDDGTLKREWERVKVAKLRGIKSFGFLTPIKLLPNMDFIRVGDNALNEDRLDGLVRRWEPIGEVKSSGTAKGPSGIIAPKYDVENYFKYTQHFIEGEEVVATEKLHGCNGRYLWDGEKFHCGSRSQWKTENETDLWWRALKNTPGLRDFLKENENVVVYGEVYGNNPNYRYGIPSGDKVRFAIFDLLLQTSRGPEWANWDVAEKTMKDSLIPMWPQPLWVPLIYKGPYNLELLKGMAAGITLMPFKGEHHIREGIVVKPVVERTYGGNYERLQVKFVSDEYLEKS